MSDIDAWIVKLHSTGSDNPDDQFKAAIALGEVTDVNVQVVNELLKALGAGHQALTRAHAAESLGKLGDQGAVQDLINALGDEYQLVRSYSARALGKLGDPVAIRPLVHSLGSDPFFGARAEAAEALRRLCPDDKTELCQEARLAIESHRKEELKRKDERSRRVLAEMDISLKEIESIIGSIVEALQQMRSDDALMLAKTGKEKMGSLFASRDRLSVLI